MLGNVHRIFKLISQGSIKFDIIQNIFTYFGITIEHANISDAGKNNTFKIVAIDKNFLIIIINNMKDISSNLNIQMNSILKNR